MDGFGWFLKSALANFGIEIDADEMRQTIETAKVLIPQIAADFKRTEERQVRIERKLDRLMAEFGLSNNPTDEKIIAAIESVQAQARPNGVINDTQKVTQ
jgi:hypothetical protein